MASRLIKNSNSILIKVHARYASKGARRSIASVNLKDLISLKEAAERSHYSPTTLRTYCRQGKIVAVRLHGRWWVVWPLKTP
ncbi:MAG: helix-turn-helix domain-containing protein [Cyanobacteria bacterium P01_H01_bin.121]